MAGFDRPNIRLVVRPVLYEDEKHQLLPALVDGRRALVYAATRRNAEVAAATLQALGMAAAAYHAGLREADRSRVQERFADGTLRIVCATNAFGMGIDRPDVDAVVHVDVPGSLDAYYQRSERLCSMSWASKADSFGINRRPASSTRGTNYITALPRSMPASSSPDSR